MDEDEKSLYDGDFVNNPTMDGNVVGRPAARLSWSPSWLAHHHPPSQSRQRRGRRRSLAPRGQISMVHARHVHGSDRFTGFAWLRVEFGRALVRVGWEGVIAVPHMRNWNQTKPESGRVRTPPTSVSLPPYHGSPTKLTIVKDWIWSYFFFFFQCAG